jgi:hypothetical protein
MLFKELGITSQTDASGSDSFGSSVATNATGDVIAVGSPGHSSNKGAVYIYRRGDDGSRNFVQKIVSSDNQTGAKFGSSISMSDDNSILVIGAPFFTGQGGRTNHGAVYVYFWDGSAFSNELRLIPTGGASPSSGSLNNTYFGHSVSVSALGHYLTVGNDAASEDGCLVYSYKKTGATSFTLLGAIENPLADAYVSKFGQSVAIDRSGHMLLVGSPDLAASDDPTFAAKPGGGFVFERRSESYELRSSIYFETTGFAFSKFGAAVAISSDGNIFAFGSPGYNNGEGAVAYFNKTSQFNTPTDFGAEGNLLQPSIGTGSNLGFGSRISLDRTGHKILVGMYGSGDTVGKLWFFETFSDHNPATNAGPCGEQLWEVNPPSTNQSGQRYGAGVALSKDGLIAVVGSPSQSTNGAVWFYKNRIYSLQRDLFNFPLDEVDFGISPNLQNASYDIIPPVSKIAQKATPSITYIGLIGFLFDKVGSPTGNINVKIVYGDAEGPYESDPLAVLHSADIDVTTISAYNILNPATIKDFAGKHRMIHENDQIWIVLTCGGAYMSSADNSNYIKILGTNESGLPPFWEYSGTWSEVSNFAICYGIGSFGSAAFRGEVGRLVTTPYDIKNSIYTLNSAPYSVNGGEKIMFEKNGFLKQTLSLPVPAIPGALTQQELVDFLNNNLNVRFNCTAISESMDGKDIVVIRNNDFFVNSVGYDEGNSFIRMSTEWDLLTNGTNPADNALCFTNGAVVWIFKPDRMSDYGILTNSSYSDWHDWHENIHLPLQSFYFSKSDRYNFPPYDYRIKITLYPIGSHPDLQWTLRSLYEFLIENFIMNPQTKKVLDMNGNYAPASLSAIVDKYHINVVYSYLYDNGSSQPFWGAIWFR